MKNSLQYFGVTVLGAAAILLSGCSSCEVSPAENTVTIARLAKPMPIAIGFVSKSQKATGGFPDLMPSLQSGLNESGLFKSVVYPVRPGDRLDGTLEVTLNSKFDPDPSLGSKAFLTGFLFFIPAPFVEYDHHYVSDCSVDLRKGDKVLKTYTARGVSTASCKIFAPAGKIESEGVGSATKQLQSEVVKQLTADRAFIEKSLKTQ